MKCKFCGKTQKTPLSKGYCVSCYQYFIQHKFIQYTQPKYGEIGIVKDKKDKQYGMIICHICGKAFTKLQQHIWYSHNLTKIEYCDLFGLDHKIRLTEDTYNSKMSKYAIDNNMGEQLKVVGVDTRFVKGNRGTYKRSYQTMQRLKNQFNNIRK